VSKKKPPLKKTEPDPLPAAPTTRRDAARFVLLGCALIVLILAWPLWHGHVAYNFGSLLTLEPWNSFPEFAQRHSAENQGRPSPGAGLLWDNESQFYPWMRFAQRQLQRGVMPLWFPDAQCGNPLNCFSHFHLNTSVFYWLS